MDILDRLALQSLETIESGYYDIDFFNREGKNSLKKALNQRRFSLIGELKYASPTYGRLKDEDSFESTVKVMEKYCAGISILTEPKSFLGSLERFVRVRELVNLPLLMKDIIVSPLQIDAAQKIGADAVLLIHSLASRGYFNLQEMAAYTHRKGLEVVVEVHSREELECVVCTEADIIGVNNRDLGTMETDVSHTCSVLEGFACGIPLLSESGFKTRHDVLKVKDIVNGILVGTALMVSENIEEAMAELSLCG